MYSPITKCETIILCFPRIEPSRGAENVSSSEVNYTTNRITWAELPKEAANGVIKLYEVRLELKESCLKCIARYLTAYYVEKNPF